MKKFSALFITMIFSAFLLLFVGINLSTSQPAKALPQNVSSANLSEFNLDETLFSALLALVNEVCTEDIPSSTTYFSTSFFASEYASYQPSSEDGQKIKSHLGQGILNLTLGENSPYERLQNFSDKIASISGLNNLDLSTIKTLILNDNEISFISFNDLGGLISIDELSVCNNKLYFFDINPELSEKIVRLKLRNNFLRKIDLSTVAVNAEVDLTANLFESVTDITIGNNLSYLDLSFNNITENFNLTSYGTQLGFSPVFLVQGLNKNSFTAGEKIAVVNDAVYGKNLIAHIKYSSESDYYEGDFDIAQSATTQGLNFLALPAGRIEISFTYDSSSELPDGNATFLEGKSISSKLPAPKVTASSNGSEITSFSQHSPMTFTFSMNNENDFIGLDEALADAVLHCGIQGEEKTDGATFHVRDFMSATLSAYYVFDDIVGDKLSFRVSYTQQSNLTLGIVVVIVLFVLIASAVYIIRWIRDGTPIAPFTPAEIAREQRRMQRKQGSGDFPYFDGSQSEQEADFLQQNLGENDDVVDLLGDEKARKNSSKNEEGRYKK